MRLTPSLSNEQTINTVLNQNVQQSLQILQMNQQDLRQMVCEEIEKNPMLEIDHEREMKYAAEAQEFFKAYRTLSRNEEGNAYLTYAHGVLEKSFTELILEQLEERELQSDLKDICKFLILCLDTNGYLKDDISELAEIMDVAEAALLKGLNIIQSFEPVGVGARSLQECLMLQLRHNGNDDEDTKTVITQGLELLAQNQISHIAKLLGGDIHRAQKACRVVRELNPIPTRGYYTGETNDYIVPDAFVEWSEGQFYIRFFRIYPQVKLNKVYHGLLHKKLDREAADYIRENSARAKTILRSIQEREHTIKRLIECIVGRQQEFFRSGDQLNPMTMSELAKELDLDVSTVSRAVQGKYIICRKGTVMLRSLFTSSFTAADGRILSADFVRCRIRKIINTEDLRHPFSDEKIREQLLKEQIPISRRTVTKHRKKMGIASSNLRRRI